MAVILQTFEQFVGGIIRQVVAETPLNDVNTGSVLFSLIEAVAQNDFENAASILNVLELNNIDVLRNNDLDSKAADYGLTRLVAVAASGAVTITDTTITEISTSLYPITPAPIKGATQINVSNASTWAATGQLYIGRGTNNFEGPIPYTSIVNNVTFYTIFLGSALQNDHLISDTVIDGQGSTDRLISAGTIVQIPANNLNPAILYATLIDAVIPAGESTVLGVEVLAQIAGSAGNAAINTITAFASLPFPGATVTNTTAFTDGSDVETDDELRDRIKAYPSTLARGTEAAILAAIQNLSDPVQHDQIESAVVVEPTAAGQPAIIYIDDGTGFQPTYQGQSVDNILINANGNEEFMQLANFPLPRPQVVNVATGPFSLINGMTLTVTVDGSDETITFSTDDFLNITAATLPEIVTAINNQATIFNARLTNQSANLLIYSTDYNAEIIQVAAITSTDNAALWANNILEFPTNPFSYIYLYQNNVLLTAREESATLVTAPFNQWGVVVASDLVLSVDGTPPQDQTFSITDFGGGSFSALTLAQWVTVFNTKFAGATATALSTGQMSISSNGIGTASSLSALGGTLLSKWFPDGNVMAAGQSSDFQLDRENGNLRILTTIEPGDDITAGALNTRGTYFSSTTISGNYNLAVDSNNRPAEMVIVADATAVTIRPVNLSIGTTITISSPSANVMRITSNSVGTFLGVFATTYDFVYITNRGDNNGLGTGAWLDIKSCGLFKVIDKDLNGLYIDVLNPQTVTGSYTVQSAEDIQAFYSDKYPQIYNAASTSNPPSASIQSIVDSINSTIINVDASVFKTNSIQLSSSSETNGSIAIPVSVGNMTNLFATGQPQIVGTPSLIANESPSQDAFTWFRITPPTGGALNPTAVWLGRYAYTDEKGALTADAIPGTEGVTPYNEIISAGLFNTSQLQYDNIINFTKGNNKGLYRSIRQILPANRVGTQFDLPVTSLNHIQTYDFVEAIESMQFGSNDSLVVVMDNNPTNNTIDINMSRTGSVNAGNSSPDPSPGTFTPTATAFSGTDLDGQPGTDFGNPQVWGTSLNNTNFNDYRMWFRARNWYVSGGVGNLGTGGSMILRATQYGPIGNNLRFAIDYPTLPSQTAPLVTYQNNPFYTQVTYIFGSGNPRTINMTSGTVFNVVSLGSNEFQYVFTSPINLNTVVPGDILSILPGSGVSAANSGTFSIVAVNAGAGTLNVYNPNGSPTGVGQPEIVSITTTADTVGTSSVYSVSTIADSGGSLDGTYFLLEDQNGSIGFWIDETGHTAIPAGASSANRNVRISTILANDTNNVVAGKIATAIINDGQMTASYAGHVITATLIQHGAYVLPGSPNGNSGFTVTQSNTGTADVSLDGLYFILQAAAGSISYWIQLNNDGHNRPADGADFGVPINTINSGDSATMVATKIAAAINTSGYFTATSSTDVVMVTDLANAARPAPNAGTSGFVISVTQPGSTGVPETVILPMSFNIFPLTNTTVSTICSTVNAAQTMMGLVATPGAGSLLITKATREETSNIAFGYTASNPYVGFYDGTAWVMQFSNNNPNFTLKAPLQLVGVAPTVYQMNTAPNYDSTALGEVFKLIPTTVTNLEHQLTQPAISTLPLVADVEIADDFRRVQITSLQLGSAGGVQIVGGRANSAEYSVIGNTQVYNALGENFLGVEISAFPDSLSTGDTVMLSNPAGVGRLSRLSAADKVDVVAVNATTYDYRFDPKEIFFNQYVNITITDVSSSYNSRPAGTVWRWAHNDGGSIYTVTDKTTGTVSPLVAAYSSSGGATTNLVDTTISNGSVTPQQFELIVVSTPAQGDYYAFQSASGATFAVWFDLGSHVAPTGGPYLTATNKIPVVITGSFTPNEAISTLAATLNVNTPFISAFSASQASGATLAGVNPGDIAYAFGTLTGWSQGNKVTATGDSEVSGLPIIGVDPGGTYFDVVNPLGVAMSSTPIGTSSTVQVTPAAIIKWNLGHAARVAIAQIIVAGGTATVTTVTGHQLNVGSEFNILDSTVVPTTPGSGVGTVATTVGFNQFTFATSTANGTYDGGTILNTTKQVTRYVIESLGFNNLFRLLYIDGTAPNFVDNGVAVDDLLILSGNTFDSRDTGSFRVRAVDNVAIIYQDATAVEQINTDNVPFNNTLTDVVWTSNSNTVTGPTGSFENVSVGDSVKKQEDPDSFYTQVTAVTSTSITLNSVYSGVSGSSLGTSFNMYTDVNKGVYLQAVDDIVILEGDAIRDTDTLFVASISNTSWFLANNTGTFTIESVGTSGPDYRPYIRVNNTSGVAQTNVSMSIDVAGFSVIEGINNQFSSVRQVNHIAIDQFNSNQRIVYLNPADRSYKFNQTNNSLIVALGKIDYPTSVVTGIDGYLYYTGLLKTTQNTIDGFEPNASTYPGYKALGATIELLPPLIHNIEISISVVTNAGVNLNDISSEIQSAIINYVNDLGVGNNVILSAITAAVMNVKGVQSCTFTNPIPSTVFIPIADTQKAYIQVSDISIS